MVHDQLCGANPAVSKASHLGRSSSPFSTNSGTSDRKYCAEARAGERAGMCSW